MPTTKTVPTILRQLTALLILSGMVLWGVPDRLTTDTGSPGQASSTDECLIATNLPADGITGDVMGPTPTPTSPPEIRITEATTNSGATRPASRPSDYPGLPRAPPPGFALSV